MNRFVKLALVSVIFVAISSSAWSQEKKIDNKSSKSSGDKLPIPDYSIPMNLNAWKKVFTIEKVTYDKDNNQIVFLVKAKRNFTFKDDGYDAPFEFLDEDGVSLITSKNLSWDKEPKELRNNEKTRVTLEVPDEDTLKKTVKSRAVVKGFFNKG